MYCIKLMKKSRKLISKSESIKKKSSKTKNYKTLSTKYNQLFSFCNNIFNSIKFEKEVKYERDFYYIISDKYNYELSSTTPTVKDFILYCLLRFKDKDYKQLLNAYILNPVNFPMNGYYAINNKFGKYNTFNYFFYLHNLLYECIEQGKTLPQIIKESKTTKIGYNCLFNSSHSSLLFSHKYFTN